MLQIKTEKKIIHGNEIAFILFQDNCDCTLLQRPLQPFSGLQEHLIKFRIAIVASGRSGQCSI